MSLDITLQMQTLQQIQDTPLENYVSLKVVQARPRFKVAMDGYQVVYKDGYKSWSPKATFEESHQKASRLTIGRSVALLEAGYCIQEQWMHQDLTSPIRQGDELNFVWLFKEPQSERTAILSVHRLHDGSFTFEQWCFSHYSREGRFYLFTDPTAYAQAQEAWKEQSKHRHIFYYP